MAYLSKFLVVLVALEHVYIMILEMFFWTSPKTLKVFGFTQELAEQTTAMAANQGLYNGFLAAGLIWTFFIDNIEWKESVSLFFLACVAIAGIYGALTADKKIFFVQALPAMIGTCLLLIK